jgi:hypothetical protein
MKLTNITLLLIASIFLVNLTDGSRKSSVNLEPSFAALEEGEGSFSATIYDESTTSEIKDVSFFGHTNIGGIRKETDDSLNRLEISKINEIRIIKRNYDSKRYSDKEFTLAQVITNNNTVIDNLLIPKHVVICGLESKTQMERSWFLSKVDKIVIGKPSGIIDRILSGVTTSTPIKTDSNKDEISQDTKEKKTEKIATLETKKILTQETEQKKPETIGDALKNFFISIVDLLRALVQSVLSLFK